MKKPELKISILSDYICPFCFIGHLRLDVLRQYYDLKINWCFIEIHPDTPPLGHTIENLNYDDDTWKKMLSHLKDLAAEENITLAEQTIITNSRKALLLSEACKKLGASVFYPLHEQLFKAYFIEGKNIGDETVLRDIAKQHHITEDIINHAWQDQYANGPASSVPAPLLPYLQYAGSLQAKSVPTFIIGKEMLSGVVTREKLIDAAKKSLDNTENSEDLN